MKIATYLINLDGSHERLVAASTQLQQHGIAFERIAAVDGRKIPAERLQKLYDSARALAYMGRALGAGEIGCYLSHLHALRNFLASDADYAVVLEDDCHLPADYRSTLRTSITWLTENGHANWQTINISNNKLKIATRLSALTADHALYHAHYFPMLATGVLWSRSGAQALLDQGQYIFCPYDNFLRYWQTRENKGYSIFPPLLNTTEVASDIDAAGKRKTIQRGTAYGWAKQKRLWQDKFIAIKHKLLSSSAITQH